MVVKNKLFQRFAGHPAMLRMMVRSAPAMDRLAHKLTRGRFTMSGSMMPILMLDTIGSRSGEPRTTPLQYARHGDGFLVVGSNFGQPKHPAWSTNLLKNPEATMMLGGVQTSVRATLLAGDERAEAWEVMTRQWPPMNDYAVHAAGRELRVFRLTARR